MKTTFQLIVMLIVLAALIHWTQPKPKLLTWEQIWAEQLAKPRPGGF